MTKVTDLFPPRWLRPDHLRNQAHQVAIEAVSIEELWNPRSRVKEPKAVLAFHGKALRLPLNKTQAFSLAALTGTQEIEAWVGHEVMLAPGIAPNKAPTIVITRAPAKPNTAAPSLNGNGQPPKDPPGAPPPAPPEDEPEDDGSSDNPDDTPDTP